MHIMHKAAFLWIAGLDIFLRELRQVTVASGSLWVVDNSFGNRWPPSCSIGGMEVLKCCCPVPSIESPVQAHTNQRSGYCKNP